LTLKGLGSLGLTAATCGFLVGCYQPGRMPSATLPPDVEPAQPRMLSRIPTSTESQTAPLAAVPPSSQTYGLPSLSLDQFSPDAPARNWTWIVLHHTATSHGSVESINAAHLARRDRNGNPWKGIGYHFVIGNGNGMDDGEIEPTFRWRGQLPGAHAGDDEHNQHGIGIVLVGNFELERPTAAQVASARRLVALLQTRYGIEKSRVLRHGDIKATACPGKYFPLDEITERPRESLLGDKATASGPVRIAAEERNRQ
jgi:N-acetylmuramoyl-L-alanine amidase